MTGYDPATLKAAYDDEFISMPFGRHKGKMLTALPRDYVRWMAENLSDPYLRTCAQNLMAGKLPPALEDCVFLTMSESEALVLIEAPFDLKDDIKELPERSWNGTLKRWQTPIQHFSEVMELFPAANVAPKLQAILDLNAAKRDVLINMNLLSDTGDRNVELDGGLALYPYQGIATRFIDATDGRCLIADEPGLGKTIEALAWLRSHPANRPILIVCPATVKGMWKREIKKWLGMDSLILSGKTPWIVSPGKKAMIINYELVDAWKDNLIANRFDTIIVDESHKIKSNAAKRSNAVIAMAHRIPHVLLLSGTPVTRYPCELFNQLHAIDPETYSSYFAFAKQYCNLHQEWIGEKQIWLSNGSSNIEELSDRLKSTIMIRRTKTQVLPELPDKIKSIIPVDLEDYAKYQTVEDTLMTPETGLSQLDGNVPAITKFTEMLMVTMRGKIKPTIQYIDDMLINVDKLVVLTTHVEMIEALEEHFSSKDVGLVKIDGSVDVSKRDGIVERFQTEPDCKLFLGNILATGVGITLTAASHVVVTELPYNPSDLEQGIDRLHRIGQENAVNAHIIIAADTIDEYIADMIVNKKQVINTINNDMSMDDLKELVQWRHKNG